MPRIKQSLQINIGFNVKKNIEPGNRETVYCIVHRRIQYLLITPSPIAVRTPVLPAPSILPFAHVNPRRGRVGSLRNGIVHPDGSLVHYHSVALHLGCGSVLQVDKVHESEPAGRLRLGIVHDLHLLDQSEPAKHGPQVRLLGVIAEAKHAEAGRRRRINRTVLFRQR